MSRLIPQIIKKENKVEKQQTKEHSALNTAKKVFIGVTAVGVIGGVVHGAGLVDTGITTDTAAAKLSNHLMINGYHAANHDYKAKQIRQLIIDCNLGIISYEDLAEGIKDENLTELDVDIFVRQYLGQEAYQEYLTLKKAEDNSRHKMYGYGRGGLVSVATALFAASGVVATGALIDHKKKKAQKKADQEEARRARQEKLATTICADDIDD